MTPVMRNRGSILSERGAALRFDVVLLGDFRFPGGTSSCIAHEIRALEQAGYGVGLVPLKAPVLKARRSMHAEIRAAVRRGAATILDRSGTGPGTRIVTRLAILHNPHAFTAAQDIGLKIEAEIKILVAHQPPTDLRGIPFYDIDTVRRVSEDLVGSGIVWAPISPVSRRTLIATRPDLPVFDQDWTNLVFIEDWMGDRTHGVADRPVIGRHSRPERHKWPATRDDLLRVYPADPSIAVRLLGGGPELEALVGAYPDNWTVFPFNALDPRDFLRTVDFFVYYHHPDWVEAFGRTIAEAAASGAVPIVPEHFRDTFAEAAVYRPAGAAIDAVRELHADWEAYRLQSRLGQRTIHRLYGPNRFLDRIRGLIGPPGAPPAARSAAHSAVAVAAVADRRRLPTEAGTAPDVGGVVADIAIMGDFRASGDAVWSVAQEARIQAAAGYRTVLVHVSADWPDMADVGPVIDPMVDACVRKGMARAVEASRLPVRAGLLVIRQPQVLFRRLLAGGVQALPRIVPDRVVVVADRPPNDPREGYDPAHRHALFSSLFGGDVIWAGTTTDIIGALREAHPTLPLEPDPWRSVVDAPRLAEGPGVARTVPVIGRVSVAHASQWPEARDELLAAYPNDPDVRVRILNLTHGRRPAFGAAPDGWEILARVEIDPVKFLSTLDFLVYYPGQDPPEVPEAAIRLAMSMGVPAILPPALAKRIGQGPLYLPASEVKATIQRLHRDPAAYSDLSMSVARRMRDEAGALIHRGRLARLIGPPTGAPKPVADRPAIGRGEGGTARPRVRSRRPVLFVSSNGVGLGHLTRLLAVARRSRPPIVPVFATMSQAAGVVGQAGYSFEYLPFHGYAGCDVNDWNDWLAEQLGQIIDFHGARALVFDGSTPYSGLIRAAAPRADCRLIWMRRALWRPFQANEPLIDRQRFFDLVIEPADIAETRDAGATVAHRRLALRVPPIRLLDEEELPDRDTAARSLGLDPARPAVLIQLGAGTNRDIVGLTDTVLAALTRYPDLQPVVAEWLIAPTPLDLWSGVTRLRGFPISRYFRAFDFTISAAGYNAFHEILGFALPAIFIANGHEAMDDQDARAAFAEEHGCAFRLTEGTIDQLDDYIAALMDQRTRWLMQANALRLAQPNGAASAADAIAGLID